MPSSCSSRIEKPVGIEAIPTPKIDSARELIEMIGSTDPTHNLMLSGALILLAMFFDSVDGQVARLTRRTSDFGAQLDSLCDLVSFGLAPAILLVKMCPQFTSLHSEAVWTIAALFVCCAALRLARFNVESDENDDHMAFAGLPTPAAAAAIASFAILSYTLRNEENLLLHAKFPIYDWWMQRLLPLFAIVIAILMVSRIPYPHLLTQFLRGQRSFAHIVAIVFALVAILIVRGYAVPLLCVMFVLIPPVRFAWEVARHRRRGKNRCFRYVRLSSLTSTKYCQAG